MEKTYIKLFSFHIFSFILLFLSHIHTKTDCNKKLKIKIILQETYITHNK